MGWPTKYKGPQIDEALEKGRNLRVVNNGWVRLESSTASPTLLGELKSPGNYVTFFWSDGPDLGGDVASPLNITVVMIGGTYNQFVDIAGKQFRRAADSNGNYGAWTADQTAGTINAGPVAPTYPVNGATMWLDTSKPAAPSLKIYLNDKWQLVMPELAMKTSVYDQRGKATDIFKYIEDRVAEAALGVLGEDIISHIEDNTIHVTEEERERWNAAATMETVNAAANTLEQNLQTTVKNTVAKDIQKVETLTTDVARVETTLSDHTKNSTIHPTAAKQQEWDNKAAAGHGHNLDGKVTVDVDHITGTIPLSKLPFEVKERVYKATNEAAVYATAKNPVHNGDALYVESTDYTTWYYVVDDTYLGSSTPAKAFKKFVSYVNIPWGSISQKPTTLSGYGISDAATAEDFARVEEELGQIGGSLPNTVDLSGMVDANTLYNEAVANLLVLDKAMVVLESAIATLETIAQ